MSRQIQPRYQVLLNGNDVTSSVKGDVSFRQEPDIITTLSFALSGNNYVIGFADVIKLGDRITFYGGTFGNSVIRPSIENYKLFFDGVVKNISPQYPETGLVSVNIEAVDSGVSTVQEKRHFVFPSKDAKYRVWANVKEIKAVDIFKNIVKDLGLIVGKVEVPNESNIVYTRKDSITQDGVNDWKFLLKLADKCGCNLFSESSEDGKTLVSLLDKGKQKNFDDKKVRFIYPLRQGGNESKPNGSGFSVPQINNLSGVSDIPVLSLSLTQDLTLFYANRRTVQVFNKVEGKNYNVIQTYDELTPAQAELNREAVSKGSPEPYKVVKTENNKQFIESYYRFEVDKDKLPEDPEERLAIEDVALKVASQDNKVSASNNKQYSFEDIKKYFKKAEFMDPRLKVVDQPYVGIDVTARIEGEVYLSNQRSYPILGIQRYGSDKLDSSYHLRIIEHVWSEEGYFCDLEFKL